MAVGNCGKRASFLTPAPILNISATERSIGGAKRAHDGAEVMARDCRWCRFSPEKGVCLNGLPPVWGVECPSFRRFRGDDSGGQNYKRRQQATLNRAGWKCEYCGDPLGDNNYSVDHRIPLSNGGSRLKQCNLRAACKPCNEAKGNMREAEFVAIISSDEPPPKFATELLRAWQRVQNNLL